jgi:tRNA G18 (ribose-2'-O)-methylase SpoU
LAWRPQSLARTVLILIDDPDDPRITAYRDVRERDLVGREGLFIAEGEVVLRHLITSARFETQSVLLAEKRLDKLGPLVEAARPDAPLYVAGQKVIDAVAGFALHRGILAVGRRGAEPTAAALLAALPAAATVLVLVGIGNHDNVGGLFRNAAAFGVAAVLLDPTSCDPLYRKAIRVSVGAALLVPFSRLGPDEDPVDVLTAAGFSPIALSPAGRDRLADLASVERAAVLLGAEGPGLPNSMLDRCRTVRIPMADGFDSLNVATTGGIVLHHLGGAGFR